ncbi:hypothetical protein BN946_scf184601.g3 [Trametes cinnabarina]|uniref:Septin-type G domain-containing protein n=1 Tax=Pycnoporus cinnabarinus TaxID=5643 RepID=A0A060S6Q5_PYCCI|nr:hypothetical protein BN946_scf184601.g3 [Trametes cinnabarina]
MEEHEPSTSASTIRGLHHLDSTLLSDPVSPQVHEVEDAHMAGTYHRPYSPHSCAYQSEPGSPSGDSISSFPSVSSSFLFSSGPASPPLLHPHSEPESELGDSTSGLVIPSLTLPSLSRRPTPYGQTLGELRLLVLGPKSVDCSAIASQLVDDNEDVIEVGIWEEEPRASGGSRANRKAVLHASTHWVEHRDAHGLERIEPARNVKIVELKPYDMHSEVDTIVERILPVIHSPFHEVMDILSHDQPPSGTVAHILSSSSSPLYTALVLLVTPSLSPMEKSLIDALYPHIPVVVLPSPSPAPTATYGHSSDLSYRIFPPDASGFRPASLEALRKGLFRSPNTLATLRAEAASRFLRWREVERAVDRVQWGVSSSSTDRHLGAKAFQSNGSSVGETRGWWDKEAWEAQWEGNLSQEVALHTSYFHGMGSSPDARGAALDTPMPRDERQGGLLSPPCPSAAAFDPLHLPSLVVFSFSLLGALRTRVGRAFGLPGSKELHRTRTIEDSSRVQEQQARKEGRRSVGFTFRIGLALMGAFCAGVGIGLFAAARF